MKTPTRRDVLKMGVAATAAPALAALPATARPVVIPIRSEPPKPLSMWFTHVPARHGTMTVIARLWEPGDAARCRLCPECGVHRDVCVVSVPRYVPPVEAGLYSLADDLSGEAGR